MVPFRWTSCSFSLGISKLIDTHARCRQAAFRSISDASVPELRSIERWGWGVKRVWVDRGAVLCAGDSTWGPAYVVLRGAMALGNGGGVLRGADLRLALCR